MSILLVEAERFKRDLEHVRREELAVEDHTALRLLLGELERMLGQARILDGEPAN